MNYLRWVGKGGNTEVCWECSGVLGRVCLEGRKH